YLATITRDTFSVLHMHGEHENRHVISIFFNDTATTEIYTLSLHDALPISSDFAVFSPGISPVKKPRNLRRSEYRKSTRLNSIHSNISHAFFCLQKKDA